MFFVSCILSASALPLLSGKIIAAGVAGGLSASISSPAVYVMAARLLKAPVPPAHACNRGLCVDGMGSVIAGLMGAPLGLCSSVSNACVIGLSQVRVYCSIPKTLLLFITTSLNYPYDVFFLSQSGSRSTVQLAGVLLLILGVSPQLAQMLCSVPLAIHGDYSFIVYSIKW